MPTYEYACTACAHRFEAVQSFSDPTLTECPQCQGRLRKLFSSVGVVFKGSGFYRNDSRAASESGGSAAEGTGEKQSDAAAAAGDKGGSASGGPAAAGSSAGSGGSGTGAAGTGAAGTGGAGTGAATKTGPKTAAKNSAA